VVKRIGAYNMTQWMQFITLRPNVVLIDPGGKVHLVRKQENMELIRQQEVIPEHLK
jgi:diaminopimelate decarboxylase